MNFSLFIFHLKVPCVQECSIQVPSKSSCGCGIDDVIMISYLTLHSQQERDKVHNGKKDDC